MKATKLPKEIEKPDAASITEIKEEDDISSRGNDAFVIDNVESIIVESPEKIRHHTRTLFGNIISSNSLDVSKDPVVNEMRMMREVVNSCPELWAYMNALCPDRKAIFDEHLCDNIV